VEDGPAAPKLPTSLYALLQEDDLQDGWFCSEIIAAALKGIGMTELHLDSPDVLFKQVQERFGTVMLHQPLAEMKSYIDESSIPEKIITIAPTSQPTATAAAAIRKAPSAHASETDTLLVAPNKLVARNNINNKPASEAPPTFLLSKLQY
jgi:hypothetical protein